MDNDAQADGPYEPAHDGLPPLREVIRRHGLRARRQLGQNFLLDLNLTGRIARAAGPLEGHTVVEIGPGPGGLTRALLAAGARSVIAIERDERCLAALAEISERYPGRLRVIPGDALEIDAAREVSGPARIIANLPYNIATPLLIGWLRGEQWPPWYASITVMVQREVADRITSPVGTKAYGRLSVICQWRAECRRLFDVDRRAFTPAPKVTSTVISLIPRKAAEPPCSASALERVTAAAFGQRRKMLRSSLKTLSDDAEAILEATGLDPTLRAEQVDIAGFCRIARWIADAEAA